MSQETMIGIALFIVGLGCGYLLRSNLLGLRYGERDTLGKCIYLRMSPTYLAKTSKVPLAKIENKFYTAEEFSMVFNAAAAKPVEVTNDVPLNKYECICEYGVELRSM